MINVFKKPTLNYDLFIIIIIILKGVYLHVCVCMTERKGERGEIK